MTRKQRRLTMIGLAGVVLAVATGLILYALSDQIVFFNSPSDVVAKGLQPGSRIRLGGLVEDGSVVKKADGVVDFSSPTATRRSRSPTRASCPTCSARGRGW